LRVLGVKLGVVQVCEGGGRWWRGDSAGGDCV
jgi:hypothetical protein